MFRIRITRVASEDLRSITNQDGGHEDLLWLFVSQERLPRHPGLYTGKFSILLCRKMAGMKTFVTVSQSRAASKLT